VKEGADIRSINRHGKKPIHSAAKNVHKNVVLFFVEKGLSINDPDKHKRWTPLHYATDSGNLDFVQTLLAEGADFNAIDVESAKPLHIAAESGYTAIVDLFIEKGLSVDDMGKYNWTPLHYAASRGHLDSVRSLIEKSKANINTKDSRGDKPIHIAAEYGYKDVIKFLLNKGSRVNDLGTSGWTPLHYAASRGHLDTVKFLVEEARADINFLSINYENPINIAIETKHEKVAEYLTQTQEKENMLHIRHMHSKIRHKRSIDQPQSSGASKQSSLIGDSIAWVRNWISGLFLQPEEVVSNTEQSRSSDWFPSSSDANQNTSFNHQTVTSIIQEKFKNINSEDMMFYYMLYSWFHGNKCKIKQKVCVNDIVLERDAIACALRVGKKFEFVVKRAANSSGISYESVRPDFVDIQKTITKKVMSGDYNTISEFLDSYIQEACPKDLNQRQVNNFKRAYNNEKIRTLNNELYGEVSTHNGPRLQSVFDKGQTNLSDISQISTPYCHVQQLKKHNIAISLAGNK
jgi:ankyrin repeat protein